MKKEKPILLILASTYPRWISDPEPAFVHELSRRLTEDFNIHVISPHAPGSKVFEIIDAVNIHRFRYAPQSLETLVQNGGILANLKNSRWKWLLLPFFFTGMLIKTIGLILYLKPNCIHVHWIIPQGLVVAFLSMFVNLPPMLLTSHGGDLFSFKGILITKLKAWVLSKFSSITVVSDLMKADVVKLGIPVERIQVIPMGVDFYHQYCPDITMLRNPNEILFVGRLVEKKGVSLLIKALPFVLERLPSVSLCIAGYGPELDNLKRLASDLNVSANISFMGAISQSELPRLYRRCGLFVVPFVTAKSGDQEGFPVSIVEAIACETPILTSQLAVLVEVFGDLADYLTCDVQNPDEFCSKIVGRMKRESGEVEKKLRNEFMQKNDWSVISNRYNAVLRRLAR